VTVDVAVVGGGPAGAIVAALLASAGREVVVLERAPSWRWRACGVFASPVAGPALRAVGLSDEDLGRSSRPIPAMRVETPGGTHIRLTYGADHSPGSAAMGFDRRVLDERLLERAVSAGADVRQGVAVMSVDLARAGLGGPGVDLGLSGGSAPVSARVVVGADGLRSLVARAAGVVRPSPLGQRIGLTFHVPDPWGDVPHDARMVVIDDGYVGLAPVPGGRLNVGIVLGTRWADALRRDGARTVVARILARLPPDDRADGSWHPIDEVEGILPLGHRVERRAGGGWLLVGDAAGFLDPFTGEGLHRAIVSAELAAGVLDGALRARNARAVAVRLEGYDRAMRGRFGTKDAVSRIVQLFLGRRAVFEYAARRLAARKTIRETLGLVIGDLVPAGRALDPRFLTRLLAP